MKLVSLSPLPKTLLETFFSDVFDEILVFSEFEEDKIIKAVEDADIVLGDYTFKCG